jgi:hypothetical protein
MYANAVMVETTAFSIAYTWARGYMQYYRNTPDNIINNTHLSLMLNGALLAVMLGVWMWKRGKKV